MEVYGSEVSLRTRGRENVAGTSPWRFAARIELVARQSAASSLSLNGDISVSWQSDECRAMQDYCIAGERTDRIHETFLLTRTHAPRARSAIST